MNDFADSVNTELLDSLGSRLYGEAWPNVRAHNIKRLKGHDPAPLGQRECDLLVNGLRRIDESRRR